VHDTGIAGDQRPGALQQCAGALQSKVADSVHHSLSNTALQLLAPGRIFGAAYEHYIEAVRDDLLHQKMPVP
jgi:hypothetical protein